MRALRLASCLLSFGLFAPIAFSDDAQGPAGKGGATEKIDDAKFVMKASMSDMTEIMTGKLAEQNAQSPAVKEFARHMIQDHTKSSQELMQIVQKSGHQPAKQLDQEHQQMASKLKDLKGQDFDKMYMQMQVMAHQKAVALFKSESQNAQDQQLKAFAEKTLPVIQQHAQMAQKIASQVGAQGGQGGTGIQRGIDNQGGQVIPNDQPRKVPPQKLPPQKRAQPDQR